MAIQNILPDPNNAISQAGDAAVGQYGPGFSSVKLSSNQKIMRDRTNGGTLISRAQSYHLWKVDITYNPMTKYEFDPIFSFLLSRQGSLKPFKVQLPQYSENNLDTTTAAVASAGSTQLLLTGHALASSNPLVGDIFHITDSSDSSHTKVYKIVRVETASDLYDDNSYDQVADPSGNQRRLTFNPPLKKSVTSGATVALAAPLIQVIQTGDSTQYSLNSNNLYSFSLKLEEACY